MHKIFKENNSTTSTGECMKLLTILIVVSLSLFVVACAAPPSDVPAAEVIDENPTPAPVEQEEIIEEVAEPEGGLLEEIQETQDSQMESLPIDTETSTFLFEGYAVGKSHEGTFDEWSGNLIFSEGRIVGGNGVIQMSSVNTGIDGLDAHLQRDDFFDVEQFPEIIVEFREVKTDSITADLTFRGVTKTISFPAEVSSSSVSTDFLLDTTDFAMSNTGVNKEVRIAFEFFAGN